MQYLNHDKSTNELNLISTLALTLLLFATIVLLVNFFTLLSFGFDITDEGFYVQSVKYAEHYPFSISKFGHLLQPLWRSCSENIVCFRQTYWIIKFAFTAMIFLLLFRVQQATSIRNSPTPESIKKRKFKSFYINFVLAVSLSTTVFFQLIYWLPTPNYNTLAMFSVLLFALGVALILRNYFLLSCVAIAIAGVVSALVKATTSLALVLCTFFVLIVLLQKAGKKATLRFAVLTSLFALSLLVLIAVLISGGVCEFVTGLNQGFIFARIMIGDNWGTFNDLIWKGKLRFDSVPKEYLNLTVITSLVLVLKVVLDESLTLKKNKLIRTVNEALTLLIVGIILIVILAFFYLNVENPTPTFNAIDWFIVAWVPLLLSNIVAIIFRLTFRCWSWVDTFVVLILILLPYSYAFGTSNSYVTQMIGGFVFIALTSSYIQKNIDHLIIVGAFCVLVVCMILPINGREMYRQPSLSSMSNNENFKVITGGSLNGIKASSDVVNYFVNLNELLSEAGFVKGAPIIDLTGASPGVLLAIEGRGVGAAWILGGYPGSVTLAEEYLKQVAESDLRASWLITEQGPRFIDSSVLNVRGLSIDENYIEVGRINLPVNYGRSNRAQKNRQIVYKPRE